MSCYFKAVADLGSGVDGELQFGLLAVVHRQTLHEEGSEAGASAATEGVEDEEALQTSALIREFPDAVQNQVDDLLTDGVVATSVVVGCILLAGDQLLGMEQLAVSAGTDLVCEGIVYSKMYFSIFLFDLWYSGCM